MTKRPEIQLNFGAFAKGIRDQLTEQGLQVPCALTYQRDADSISTLYSMDLLTEAEVSRARARLLKSITAAVQPLRKRKAKP